MTKIGKNYITQTDLPVKVIAINLDNMLYDIHTLWTFRDLSFFQDIFYRCRIYRPMALFSVIPYQIFHHILHLN